MRIPGFFPVLPLPPAESRHFCITNIHQEAHSHESGSFLREMPRSYDGEAWSNIPECNESFDTRSRSHRPCLFGAILLATTFCRLAKSPLQIEPQRGVFIPVSEAKPRRADRSRGLSWLVVAFHAMEVPMKVSTTREAFRIYDGEAWRGDASPLQIHPQRGVFVRISEAKPRSADRSRSFHGSLWRFTPWRLV